MIGVHSNIRLRIKPASGNARGRGVTLFVTGREIDACRRWGLSLTATDSLEALFFAALTKEKQMRRMISLVSLTNWVYAGRPA
jgi:hypothetical protein